jgi:hypothetical protein
MTCTLQESQNKPVFFSKDIFYAGLQHTIIQTCIFLEDLPLFEIFFDRYTEMKIT